MLHSLESLIGASVVAADGETGRVCNFLFDDQSWTIRYAAVDVRRWLSRHDVLIDAAMLDHPDWAKKIWPCRLTREQVRHCPDVESKQPVSRQQENAMKEYYGWPAYWTSLNLEFPSPLLPAGRKFPGDSKADQHLRSAEDVTGYEVWDGDSEIGNLRDFIVDEGSLHIGYLDVQAGDWLLRRSMLLPTGWVNTISWAEHRVNLNRARAALQLR